MIPAPVETLDRPATFWHQNAQVGPPEREGERIPSSGRGGQTSRHAQEETGRMSEQVRGRRDAAHKLGGAQVPRSWLRGMPLRTDATGRGAVPTNQGDPPPRPSPILGGRA